MLTKIKEFLGKTQELWRMAQDIVSVKGGLYVDAFALAVLLRLLGPFKGYPAMTPQEAGLWAATIAAFAYSNNGPKDGQA